MDGTVLLADDDRTIRTVLTQALTRAGCRVHATSSLTTLMRWVGEGRGDVVISDVAMPDGNGLEMLPKIAQDRPDLPVIVISAQNTIMTAIRAEEAQAFDYLPKPFDLPDLMKRTARALDRSTRRNRGAGEAVDEARDDLPMVGRTPVMQSLYRLVARMISAEMPLLIWGESGTGKSLIARAIHDFSDRRSLPFVQVTAQDLADLEGPAKLLAKVRGGTLMVDEVADLPLESQGRLVRMMDAPGEQVPRYLATSRPDLASALAKGLLREDLYYRLTGATLHVPTLRDRAEDIPLLAQHFLQAGTAPSRSLTDGAAHVLVKYAWPGNVRQLENVMAQLTLSAQGLNITQAEAETALAGQPGVAEITTIGDSDRLGTSVARHIQRYFDQHGGMLPPEGLYQRILREIEVPLIEISLAATAGNQAKCADLLGINRNTLRKKITELDIEVTRGRKMM
ncbi:MAG: response regulator [Sulfitobacter sp.]